MAAAGKLMLLALALGGVLLLTGCSSGTGGTTNSSRATGTNKSATGSADAQILAAGDIAACYSKGDEATAALLDRLRGLVVPLGDTTYDYGTPAEFANCYAPTWGRYLARTRPIVGDHDYGTAGASAYFDYFGAAAGPAGADKGYYSYDLGSWHIVALNSYCNEAETCSGEMEDWLAADLAAHPATCTLGLYHEPLFSSGDIHGNNPGSQYLWEIMYGEGVDVVLSASEHIYERFAPQTPGGEADPQTGIREFIVGTGGASHYGIGTVQPNSEVRNAGTFGILKMSLHPAGYEWRFVPEAGKKFTDSGSASCH